MLTNASDPVVSKTQATSLAASKVDAAIPLGHRRYQLLGVRFFNPGSRKEQKVVVKGVFMTGAGESRINVTSLETVAPACNSMARGIPEIPAKRTASPFQRAALPNMIRLDE